MDKNCTVKYKEFAEIVKPVQKWLSINAYKNDMITIHADRAVMYDGVYASVYKIEVDTSE